MTKEEYINIGKKYLDYCQYNDCFYIPGRARWFNGAYQVAELKQTGGVRVYYHCVVDEGEVMTDMKCIEVYDSSAFEEAIQKFQKSYKEALVELKKCDIDKDFEND